MNETKDSQKCSGYTPDNGVSTSAASSAPYTIKCFERGIRDGVELTNRASEGSCTPVCSSSSLIPDPGVLGGLEDCAKTISANIDVLLRDLRGSLHGMSDLTVEATECFTGAISTSCDSVDAAIKNIYAVLAKAEELNDAMSGIRNLSAHVKDIKRSVDLLETHLLADSLT